MHAIDLNGRCNKIRKLKRSQRDKNILFIVHNLRRPVIIRLQLCRQHVHHDTIMFIIDSLLMSHKPTAETSVHHPLITFDWSSFEPLLQIMSAFVCVSLYKEIIIIITKSQKEETIRGMMIRVTTSSDRLQTASETN